MSDNKDVLHRAEEHGQARELQAKEVLAWLLVSGCKAVVVAVAASLVVTLACLWLKEPVTMLTSIAVLGGVWVVSMAYHVLGDLDTLVDGLRQFRFVETYAPTSQQPEQSALPSSPIVVKPYQGEPYVLGRQEPLALPDGRQSGLSLNPPTVAAILREVITRHDGLWSRDRLMGIRVNGERVTRSFYEQLTNALAKAGFLQERPTGGFRLPQDVQEFDDLARYLPGLAEPEGGNPTRTAGRQAGRPEQGRVEGGKLASGEVGTLAERRKQKYIELGCDRYLKWRENHGS